MGGNYVEDMPGNGDVAPAAQQPAAQNEPPGARASGFFVGLLRLDFCQFLDR
jgi:hypothetical protein